MKEYVIYIKKFNSNFESPEDIPYQIEIATLEEAVVEYMRLIKEIEQGFHKENNKSIVVSIFAKEEEEEGEIREVKLYFHKSRKKRWDQDGKIESMLSYEDYLQRKIWTPEEITRKVLEEIDSYDKEIQEGYYDIYITDDEYGIRLVDSGMDYNGESYDCYKNVGTVDSRYVSINIDDLWV